MHYDPSRYSQILLERTVAISSMFNTPLEQIEVFESPNKHFRNRSRFCVINGGISSEGKRQPNEYAMWDHGVCWVQIDYFPIACELINRAMRGLRELLLTVQDEAMHQIRAAHFLSTTTKRSLVITLVYEKHIDEQAWGGVAGDVRDRLAAMLSITELSIIAKARKQKVYSRSLFLLFHSYF